MNGHTSSDHERPLLNDVGAAYRYPPTVGHPNPFVLERLYFDGVVLPLARRKLNLDPRRAFVVYVLLLNLCLQGSSCVFPAPDETTSCVDDPTLLVDVFGDDNLREEMRGGREGSVFESRLREETN